MNNRYQQQCLALFFIGTVLLSTLVPAIAFAVEKQAYGSISQDDHRAFNVKSNNIKKTQKLETKETARPTLKQIDDFGVINWGDLLGVAFKLISTPQSSGTDSPLDKVDKIGQLTSSEFSWTKIITLGLQFVLSFFGNDSVAMDKMDPGSPIEAFLSAIIAYFTGSNDAKELSVMAKQATELWGIVISLLDALRTSFSQRSLQARAIGSNDLVADAAIASTSMMKGLIKSYNTQKERCQEKYVCEFNKECADQTSESGYLFCQMATYALSYALDGLSTSSYTPFEVLSDAGRMGRLGQDCSLSFRECEDSYF